MPFITIIYLPLIELNLKNTWVFKSQAIFFDIVNIIKIEIYYGNIYWYSDE